MTYPAILRRIKTARTTKIIAACALSITLSGQIYAQDTKRELAQRAIAAQEGSEQQRLIAQLTGTAIGPLIARWNERIGQMPAAKQDAAIKTLDAELKKYETDATQIITAQATKSKGEALVSAYAERFSEDELKQLVALMEAPIFKKYQGIAPELGNAYVKSIVDGARDRITQRSKAFDAAAEKITGPAIGGAPTGGPTSAPAAPAAPVKK